MPVARAHKALGLLAAAALVAVPATGVATSAERAGTPTVKVGDDFYSPTSLKIKTGDKVKFKWDATNVNSHNVVLRDGPKGVKKGCPTKGPDAFSPLISKCNKSSTGSIGIRFTKKFDKPGKYDFLCTIHPDVMKISIAVGK